MPCTQQPHRPRPGSTAFTTQLNGTPCGLRDAQLPKAAATPQHTQSCGVSERENMLGGVSSRQNAFTNHTRDTPVIAMASCWGDTLNLRVVNLRLLRPPSTRGLGRRGAPIVVLRKPTARRRTRGGQHVSPSKSGFLLLPVCGTR